MSEEQKLAVRTALIVLDQIARRSVDPSSRALAEEGVRELREQFKEEDLRSIFAGFLK